MLPLSFVANTTFPYEEKLEAARLYLVAKGITGCRPVRRNAAGIRDGLAAVEKPKLTLLSRSPVAH